MQNFMVVYYMPEWNSVFTMSIRAENVARAEEEVHKRLRQKSGVGLWRYEIYPYSAAHSGEINTKVDR